MAKAYAIARRFILTLADRAANAVIATASKTCSYQLGLVLCQMLFDKGFNIGVITLL
jgi:hypothetical protein